MRDPIRAIIITAIGSLTEIMVKNNKLLDNVRNEKEYEHCQGIIMDAELAMTKLLALMGSESCVVEGYNLDKSIRDLGLSTRAINTLLSCDIRTVGGVLAATPRQIMKTRNCGKLTLQEIKNALKANGFNWGFEPL